MKALDEIYKIYRLLHRSDLTISATKSSEIFQNEYLFFQEISCFPEFISEQFAILRFFTFKFDELLSEFRDCLQTLENKKETCTICCHILRDVPEISETE